MTPPVVYNGRTGLQTGETATSAPISLLDSTPATGCTMRLTRRLGGARPHMERSFKPSREDRHGAEPAFDARSGGRRRERLRDADRGGPLGADRVLPRSLGR